MKIVREETGLKIDLSSYSGVEKLDGEARTVLYRIVQEALSNVTQHAKASRATVRLTAHKDKVCMDIHDNGRGFQMDKVEAEERGKHLGLLGMRERVEMVGGTFCLESAPGKQTTIRVNIPLQKLGTKRRPLKKSRNTTLECP